MNKISINGNDYCSPFKGEQYEIDLDREFEGFEPDDLICRTQPFFGIPLTLEMAIRADGSMIFRSWKWNGKGNWYLHTDEKPESFTATKEQIDTVNGLWSGRILFEGLKLDPAASLQKICPIDVKREETLIGKKIYFA